MGRKKRWRREREAERVERLEKEAREQGFDDIYLTPSQRGRTPREQARKRRYYRASRRVDEEYDGG